MTNGSIAAVLVLLMPPPRTSIALPEPVPALSVESTNCSSIAPLFVSDPPD